MGKEMIFSKLNRTLKITILSDSDSWINKYVPVLIKQLKIRGHKIQWVHSALKITRGDLVFCVGCSQKLPLKILIKNKHNLVIHESALPKGKGWSPLTWQILEGKSKVPITLFEAAENIDSGKIYLRDLMRFKGDELVDDLRKIQATKTNDMILKFINLYPQIIKKAALQQGNSTFYRRRKPEDSKLDIRKSIADQFNLIRVCDNKKYPLFFIYKGNRYLLSVSKDKNDK